MSDATVTFDLESSTAFAAVCGGYAAALLVPPTLVLALGSAPAAGRQYVGLLVTGAAIALAAGVAMRRVAEPLGRRLGASRGRWLLVPLPFAYLPLGIEDVVPLGAGLVAAVVGLLLGLVVVVMAGNRHVRARYGGSRIDASFTAGWTSRRRRLALAGVGAWVLVAGTGGLLQGFDGPWLLMLNATGGVVGGVVGGTAERDYEVTETALLRRSPVAAAALPWDRFEWFAVEDDALVLGRRFWTTRLDRDAIEDEAAVRTALAAHLPER